MNPPRILIAGVTGFLGSRLAHEFIKRDNAIVYGTCRAASSLSRLGGIRSSITLTDIERDGLKVVFDSNRFDVVINCLCDYGRGSSQTDVMQANYLIPSQLFDLAAEHEVKVFLNTGTSLAANVSEYANSKQLFSRYMQERSSVCVAIDAQLEHFYGPGESDKQFICFLARSFVEPASELNLTAGEQQRDFIYIDDVVSAICLLVEQGVNWRPGYYSIPVGTGSAYPLRDLVELVRELTNNSQTVVNFGAVPYREHEVMYSRADIRAIQELGWQPKFSLREGIHQTIQAYRQLDSNKRVA